MDTRVAQKITRETSAFYQVHAKSFASTREAAWEGFDLILSHLPKTGKLKVLDLAAGNARFEGALAKALPTLSIKAHLVDAVPALLENMNSSAKEALSSRQLSLKQTSLDLSDRASQKDVQNIMLEFQPDLIVSFGFLHHLYGADTRSDFVRMLAAFAPQEAILALSLWAPLENVRLAKKAEATTPLALQKLGLSSADLEAGDCFLNWQGNNSYFRYIHSFSKSEVQSMEHIVMENKCFICESAELDTNNYYIVARKQNEAL